MATVVPAVPAQDRDAEPSFVDAAGGDYHLLATSACIGRGTGGVPLPATDFEGDPRAAFGGADIGADEHFQHLYHVGRAAPGGSIEMRFLGLPNEAAFWLLSTGVAAPIAIPGLKGALLLQPASLVGLRQGTLPAAGLVRLAVPIPAGFPRVSIPTQALIGVQFTNLDPIAVR